MASSSRLLCRLSSRLQPFAVNKKTHSSSLLSPFKPISQSATRARPPSRLPLELGSLDTIMPLHSAIASARLISSLSVESKSWTLVPQGISMPL